MPVALQNVAFNAFTFLIVSRTFNAAEIETGLSRVHAPTSEPRDGVKCEATLRL